MLLKSESKTRRIFSSPNHQISSDDLDFWDFPTSTTSSRMFLDCDLCLFCSTDVSTGGSSFLQAAPMKSFPLSGAGFTSHQPGTKVSGSCLRHAHLSYDWLRGFRESQYKRSSICLEFASSHRKLNMPLMLCSVSEYHLSHIPWCDDESHFPV